MNGQRRRTAVITGASSGVGRAAAIELAREGWNIVALGRDPQRCADALQAIRAAATDGAHVEMISGDLASLTDTARMADAIPAATGVVHALCNNAGGVSDRMAITAEGNEATFAGNHLGHFLLTKRLLPALRAGVSAGGGRIVNVSSEGHRQAPEFDWDDLQGMRNWVSGRNYCTAKLCNLLFTAELVRRYAAEGIVAYGMHPGEADTNFASHAVPEMQAYIAMLDMIPPEVAGHTMAWLASSDAADRTVGGYFFDCNEVPASPRAHDAELGARLWHESEALLAAHGY